MAAGEDHWRIAHLVHIELDCGPVVGLLVCSPVTLYIKVETVTF
jgi:hypothetical protein